MYDHTITKGGTLHQKNNALEKGALFFYFDKDVKNQT